MNTIPTRRAAFLPAALALLPLALLPLAPARAQTQLLTNGGFETGTLAGWTTATQTPAGNTSGFFLADNTPSPNYSPNDPSTGYPFYTPTTPVNDFPTVGARSGNYYAVSDADGPASNALYQSFTVPVNATKVTLSFSLFVNARNGAGAQNTGGTLDYAQAADTQFARVDLLSANAGAFSLGAGNVLRNFYTGVDPNVGPNTLYPVPYKDYPSDPNDPNASLFDLTGIALPGQTYKIRFADVSNRQVFNTGVDNVSILAIGPTAGAPEPGTLALLGAGLVTSVGLTGTVRRYKVRNAARA